MSVSPLPWLPASVKTKLGVLGTSKKGPCPNPRPRPHVPSRLSSSRHTSLQGHPFLFKFQITVSAGPSLTMSPQPEPLAAPARSRAPGGRDSGLSGPPRDPCRQPQPGGEARNAPPPTAEPSFRKENKVAISGRASVPDFL